MEINALHTSLVTELRGLRAEAGLTLRELSLRVHMSDSSLSRYFTGQALPPWEVVGRSREALPLVTAVRPAAR